MKLLAKVGFVWYMTSDYKVDLDADLDANIFSSLLVCYR